MRMTILSVFLCAGTTALCQSTAPPPAGPDNRRLLWWSLHRPAAISASFHPDGISLPWDRYQRQGCLCGLM